MDSSYSPKSSKDASATSTQRKLRRSSLALAGVNKNALAIAEPNDISSPDSNASSEKSGKSGFSIFGLFSRKKADSEADLLKKDDSFSTFSTEECSSPSYSFSSSDNKVLEDVPKRRFSLGLEARAGPAPIMVNGSPIKISAKRQSMSLVNAPVDKRSSKVVSRSEERCSTEGAISFRNPVLLFAGDRKSQSDLDIVTDTEVLSNSISNPEDEEVEETETEEEDTTAAPSGGKRRSSVTLTVPSSVIEAKGTAKAKYYFMRRSISLKSSIVDDESEAEAAAEIPPPVDVPSSPSKAKFVLWQSVDAEETVDAPSVGPTIFEEAVMERQFETVVQRDGRRLSVRAVSENAPPAPAPPLLTPESAIPESTVVATVDGRRLSVRAVSANAPPAPAPPASNASSKTTVVEAADGRRMSVRALSLNAPPAPAPPRRDSEPSQSPPPPAAEDEKQSQRRVSVRAVTEGAPPAPSPPPPFPSARVSVRDISVQEANCPVVVQSPDGRRLSVRAVSAGAPPAPSPPARDSFSGDVNGGSVTVLSPEGRRLSVRSVSDNAPPAPAPPRRDSQRVVGEAAVDSSITGATSNSVPPPPPKRLSLGNQEGIEVIQNTDGRRLSVRAVSVNAPPAPAPPAAAPRGSVRLSADNGVTIVQGGDGRRLSVRALSDNAPPAPAPPSR